MATTYHYQKDSQIVGPVLFRDLVRLVAVEDLNANDEVKADWQTEWRPAAELVGLFHMAGRDDVLAQWQAEQRQRQRSQCDSESLTEFDLEELLSAAAETQSEQSYSDRNLPFARDAELDETELSQSMAAAVNAAMDELDQQPIKGSSQRWSFRPPRESLPIHTFTRWGLALLCGNLMAFGLWHWSHQEALRFPSAKASSAMRPFPVIGPCSHTQFMFLLGDFMLIGAGLGYGLARVLESVADG